MINHQKHFISVLFLFVFVTTISCTGKKGNDTTGDKNDTNKTSSPTNSTISIPSNGITDFVEAS